MKLAFQKKKSTSLHRLDAHQSAVRRIYGGSLSAALTPPTGRPAGRRVAGQQQNPARAGGRLDGTGGSLSRCGAGSHARGPAAARRWPTPARPRAQLGDTTASRACRAPAHVRPCVGHARRKRDGMGGVVAAVTTETRRAVAISAWTKRQGRTCCADRSRPVPSPPDDGPTWVLCCA